MGPTTLSSLSPHDSSHSPPSSTLPPPLQHPLLPSPLSALVGPPPRSGGDDHRSGGNNLPPPRSSGSPSQCGDLEAATSMATEAGRFGPVVTRLPPSGHGNDTGSGILILDLEWCAWVIFGFSPWYRYLAWERYLAWYQYQVCFNARYRDEHPLSPSWYRQKSHIRDALRPCLERGDFLKKSLVEIKLVSLKSASQPGP